MEIKCNSCNKNFNSEASLSQHNLAKHSSHSRAKTNINYKKYFFIGGIALIIIFSSLTVYSLVKKPGNYDDFAKCLTEKGAVIYGNDFCHYTQNQLGFFGSSKKYLNYVKCFDNKILCDEKGIEITPTWEINENIYRGVQTFEMLSKLSGCEI